MSILDGGPGSDYVFASGPAADTINGGDGDESSASCRTTPARMARTWSTAVPASTKAGSSCG